MNSSRRVALAFAGAATIYVLAAFVTVDAEQHPVRALYEGIGPAPPYEWVHPPGALRANNTQPIGATLAIGFAGNGNVQTSFTIPDGEFVLTVAKGSFARVDGAQNILLGIEPADPAKLGRLPPGLFSDGNAYRVTANYQPGGRAAPQSLQPIDALIQEPASAVAVLDSPDGRTWSRLNIRHVPGQAVVATTFTTLGYIMTAANHQIVPPQPSGIAQSLLIGILAGVAVLVAAAAALITRSGRLGTRGRRGRRGRPGGSSNGVHGDRTR
jgi:hypothetical protein